MTPSALTSADSSTTTAVSNGFPTQDNSTCPLPRRVSFDYGSDFNPDWHKRLPEFAAAANAVSLMMPHAEPMIAKAVRTGLAGVDVQLAKEGENYVRQELEHHRQHRLLNQQIAAVHPGVLRVDRALGWVFGRLENRSDAFKLAFASGFETLAYAGARWTDERVRQLFEGSDPVPATLFLWHLAEEVEHKNVAFDVFRAQRELKRPGSRLTQAAGMVTVALILALFALIGTWTLLLSQKRFFRPMAHVRLAWWSLSFIFEAVPLMAVSLLPGHHPSSLTDPSWSALWLKGYDPETETMPLWNA